MYVFKSRIIKASQQNTNACCRLMSDYEVTLVNDNSMFFCPIWTNVSLIPSVTYELTISSVREPSPCITSPIAHISTGRSFTLGSRVQKKVRSLLAILQAYQIDCFLSTIPGRPVEGTCRTARSISIQES
jgi:hypothetical protein